MAIYCVFCRNLHVFRCKFFLQKFCSCKTNDKYQVWRCYETFITMPDFAVQLHDFTYIWLPEVSLYWCSSCLLSLVHFCMWLITLNSLIFCLLMIFATVPCHCLIVNGLTLCDIHCTFSVSWLQIYKTVSKVSKKGQDKL